jgi:hypothetical protein
MTPLARALEYLDWETRKGNETKLGYRVLYLLGYAKCPSCKDNDIPCDHCGSIGWLEKDDDS